MGSLRLEFLKDWGGGLTNWTEKWIPDSLVIVWALSIIAYIFALIWGDVSPANAVHAWGKGFWILLKFGMQMCLVMMTGYILACSTPVKRLLNVLSSLPQSDKPWQAIMVMSLFSMITAWFNWGLCLTGSALLALFIVKNNPKVDYRLLVAGAYLGLCCTWHAGLSASAPLLVNTPNNFLIENGYLANTISTSATIFAPFNIILLLIVITVVTILMSVMHPSEDKTYRIKPELMNRLKLSESHIRPSGKLTPSEWLNWWPGWNIIIGLAGIWWLSKEVTEVGFYRAVNLNNINFFFLILGIFFHWRPWSFLKATEEAGKAVWGIIVQFPFYAGIFGLFKYTALATTFTNAFMAMSSNSTFLLAVYWYAGILNYLIPSGGSEWIITAPYLLPAAIKSNISVGKMVLAFCWGDMTTNLIQPFWAIAMLSIAKLEFREIMGWLLLVFVALFIIVSTAFLFLPML